MKNIKEISLWTSHVFFAPSIDDSMYKDKLRISKNWISYERLSFPNNKVINQWSLKTTNEDFESKFTLLSHEVINVFERDQAFIKMTDIGGYSIRVTYDDDTYDTEEFSSNFHFNKMDNLAQAFLDMIPGDELFSDFLLFDEIDDIDIEKIDIIIKNLKGKVDIKWEYPETKESGIVLPSPIYPEWILDIFELIPSDYRYDRTMSFIREYSIPIEEYDYRQIKAAITEIARGEHFGDGYIVTQIENGRLLKILERLKEIITEENSL